MTINLNNEETLYHSTTRRYLLAVLIIALLSSSAFYALHSALSGSEATAYMVNLSGRQRMLSQHIALEAHRLHQSYQAGVALTEQKLSQIDKDIFSMRQANRQLSSGVLSNNKTVDLSSTIREIYFGEMDLYKRVNNYLDIAQKFKTSSVSGDRLFYLSLIDSQSEQLLKDLHIAVQQYQFEGEESLSRIGDLELFVWIATIAALVLEVLFIFRPMVKIIILSRRNQEKTLESLEEIIELRTLKLEIANEKLKEVATHDPLTKLKNRLTLENDIEMLIKWSKKNHLPFALAVIDIDFFKEVNDSFGHLAGDYVLKELATLMLGITRDYDHLYRVGGEEFILVLNKVKAGEMIAILEKLRSAVEKHKFDYDGKGIDITVSIGAYHSTQLHLTRVQDIIRVSDQALYAAKNSGRNCVRVALYESVKPELQHI
ncbi:diguanylate cyclase domain-containing protein [Vibrio sagamiensis]|uniref:diguanylate cyclase n=1 Tax=Vibrio sagamiensis NBRC 104589 TaxID=1219064 RepID=A0A511QEW7_9VIBR|nr:diguanylate cyclase [Vibrio sagamiensis]PNQ54504.1 hypothetical protein C1141_15540 [Vibrio agarivorans]GEM75839.1 hypothetical protein VSA01S_19510 [Vibrio sagamiensis NBRC 104589]